jgi:hypothetical protein
MADEAMSHLFVRQTAVFSPPKPAKSVFYDKTVQGIA